MGQIAPGSGLYLVRQLRRRFGGARRFGKARMPASWTFLVGAQAPWSEQGDYDNAIWVDPTTKITSLSADWTFTSRRDGGTTFVKISDWRLAARRANRRRSPSIVSVPGFSTSNPWFIKRWRAQMRTTSLPLGPESSNSSWQNMNNGLNVTQFYGWRGARAARRRIIGGTQEQRRLELVQARRGHVRQAATEGTRPSIRSMTRRFTANMSHASVHLKTGAGGRQFICAGITEAFEKRKQHRLLRCQRHGRKPTSFPRSSSIRTAATACLVGANSLWVTNNVRDFTPTWTAIKAPIGTGAEGRFINAIAVAQGNPNIIWVGQYDRRNLQDHRWSSPSPTWTQVGSSSQPAATVTRLTIDPQPGSRGATFSGFPAAVSG